MGCRYILSDGPADNHWCQEWGAACYPSVLYVQDGDRMFVSASNGGMPTNPDWYHNLLAHPEVTVEVGDQPFQAKAVVITGKERDEIYAKQAKLMPNYEEYQQQTTRVIPVVELVRQEAWRLLKGVT